MVLPCLLICGTWPPSGVAERIDGLLGGFRDYEVRDGSGYLRRLPTRHSSRRAYPRPPASRSTSRTCEPGESQIKGDVGGDPPPLASPKLARQAVIDSRSKWFKSFRTLSKADQGAQQMRPVVAVLIAVIVAALGTACSSGGATTGLHVDHPSATVRTAGTTVAAPQAAQPTPADTAINESAFCAAARKVGLGHLSADGGSGADPAAMLGGVDHLATLAPARIRSDFALFDRFEHAVLDTRHGRPPDLERLNTPRLAQAMHRVGAYLSGVCGISG
jgi:hypothetical protein